ncbi:diaminobutyrate acetyltransferase [Streptomyces fuscigenes]|uniref:diaminobutyrate acetyltransferase n=1 Tax=Streptomyces fuscigenes TaxID=1528880 RepID=UPI001F43F0C8|nr:diaminobutyrate acetyltransferase [Streptomyces fuscigenes]MCF3964711.1 diaminobutyrate acetyltransferase [Streptomyces fuscigenes]
MTAAQADLAGASSEFTSSSGSPGSFVIDTPRVEDGAALWRIARDSEVLDLNSSYSYLLWCRDFAATSVVARDSAGAPMGFVTGYLRPQRPDVLVVWQVAVDGAHRGKGIAGALLDELAGRAVRDLGVSGLETTVTPDNVPSDRMFTAFAARRGATLSREVLFDGDLFPADGDGAHAPEVLYRIGPLTSG